MVISTHLPPPVMIDSTAARQCVDAHIVLDLGLIQNGSRAFYVITGEQIRAARGLLGWSQSELAKRAELSLPTVKRVEAGTGPGVSDEARRRIQQALERGALNSLPKMAEARGSDYKKRSRPRAPKK
jgi:DNA-binding XRE family transcriptional regulator